MLHNEKVAYLNGKKKNTYIFFLKKELLSEKKKLGMQSQEAPIWNAAAPLQQSPCPTNFLSA